eukprot:CAMPEP_0167743962 /NCGR_PEP_ID=MMETSP0110_2-20121227/2310_1 /TAXON_ID=629695 /ORGANISM="Gymnochlora sp., Strain CCMP2014" /LENGTH=539 /DNA_ID=CAMNT_0007628397 /DNA_START=374 /DNA_END=1993 /DNA_ORIENTATION=+
MASGEARSRSLWVGELSFDTEEASLVSVFQQIGPLESVRICRDGKTKRSLGYAYVNYQRSADAQKAAEELNFRKIKGKPCRIMLQLKDPKKRQNLRQEDSNVVIKNLPRGRIEARELYELLVDVSGSRITSCKIGTDRNTGAALGYAFAQFASAKEAKAAIDRINEARIDFDGRTVSAELYNAEKAVSTVYIRGLPGWWSREEIANFFQTSYGDVDSVRVPPSCAGSCFVRFVEARDAENTIRLLHNKVMNGRKLVVERAMTGLERRRRLLEGRRGQGRQGRATTPSPPNRRKPKSEKSRRRRNGQQNRAQNQASQSQWNPQQQQQQQPQQQIGGGYGNWTYPGQQLRTSTGYAPPKNIQSVPQGQTNLRMNGRVWKNQTPQRKTAQYETKQKHLAPTPELNSRRHRSLSPVEVLSRQGVVQGGDRRVMNSTDENAPDFSRFSLGREWKSPLAQPRTQAISASVIERPSRFPTAPVLFMSGWEHKIPVAEKPPKKPDFRSLLEKTKRLTLKDVDPIALNKPKQPPVWGLPQNKFRRGQW